MQGSHTKSTIQSLQKDAKHHDDPFERTKQPFRLIQATDFPARPFVSRTQVVASDT